MLGLIYNGTPRYEVNAEVLRTKIMPRIKYAEVETINTPLTSSQITRPLPIVEVPNGNGETVKVMVDQNGDVVAAEKKQNWVPLALAAGAIFLMS